VPAPVFLDDLEPTAEAELVIVPRDLACDASLRIRPRPNDVSDPKLGSLDRRAVGIDDRGLDFNGSRLFDRTSVLRRP
jgi:hypothetical protein